MNDIIREIRNLQDEEIEQWIENRTNLLESTAEETRSEISLNSFTFRRKRGEKENTEVHGYIPSTTRLKKMSYDIGAFVLDDKSFYKMIVDSIKSSSESNLENGPYVMFLIQQNINEYFGNDGDAEKRKALYEQAEENDGKPLSINAFYKNNVAMCAERAAMGQNILAFLGFDPMMIYGYLSSNHGISNESHAYNCIIRNEQSVIVDFSNPILCNGEIHRAANFLIDNNSLEEFKKGNGMVEVNHKDYATIMDGTIAEISTKLVYSSETINPNHFNSSTDNNQ